MATMNILRLCTIGLSFAFTIGGQPSYHTGSVYCEKRSCKFVDGNLDFDKASAVATFNDSLLVSGWGILDVVAGNATSGPKPSDTDIMFAAGFIEGVLTAKQMDNHFIDTFTPYFPKPVDKKLKRKLNQWFVEQSKWAKNEMDKHKDDPLWRHASYIFAQFDGLFAGYRSVSMDKKNALDLFAIRYLNAIGDLDDILKALRPDDENWQANKNFDNNRCSALIKLLPGLENIFMSHATWYLYASTNRIYKHYNFNVQDIKTAAQKLSFSSYPGVLSSVDDFYQLGSGMVMLQTTNSVHNKTLFKQVTAHALMAWHRVRIANMMAHDGREWTQIISQYNSGTYNNQYMLVDLKLVKYKNPLPDNTLWVAEQIPGLVVAQDLTHELQFGYFPSYNIPYFEDIYNKSGYPQRVKERGTDYSYQLAPRAKIFRRDQATVKDLESMKSLMRSNDYKHDPYSEEKPRNAICSRIDLGPKPWPVGCFDAKVCDIRMARQFEADIISGPTTGTNLPEFSWARWNKTVAHVGLPDIYNFPFISTKPRFSEK